ncbi:MAG TPA: sortase [Candidatus Dormibacteraeota bacterium]
MARRELSPRRRWLRRASWACLGLGVLLFGYVGVLVGYQNFQQGRLSSDWAKAHPAATIHNSTFNASAVSLHIVPHLAQGEPVARISIPSVGYSGIVTEGDDRGILSSGPGHNSETGYPSEGRDIVIANHNGFSFSWSDIKNGAQIVVEMAYGRYTYTVVSRRIVGGDDNAVINSAPAGERLQIITCWPLWAGALAQQRLVYDAVPVTGGSS